MLILIVKINSADKIQSFYHDCDHNMLAFAKVDSLSSNSHDFVLFARESIAWVCICIRIRICLHNLHVI